MKKYLLSGLLAVTMAVIAGCSSQHAPAPTPNSQSQSSSSSTSTATNVSGQNIFNQNCAGCHGAAGTGGSGPALNKEKRTQSQVADVTKNGRGSMTGFAKKLSDVQIQAVAQYVANLKQ